LSVCDGAPQRKLAANEPTNEKVTPILRPKFISPAILD
jgi:hypothetical protein